MRIKAGWFAALLYLFCVLAPGAALALGEAASCLAHQPGTAAAAHVHDGAQPEHGAAHQHHASAGHVMTGHAGHQHDGDASPGPCCAVLCVSAIAADPPAVAKPSPPISLCAAENFQLLPGEAPPLLYRPPIA
ncbi:hypothetical protein [Bradyrhizobium retamae]|uniref:hypothetical protein n=1 Tax=Bradyrhizobium retamae TaxID=1300035 RepID=UPI001FD8F574|nr:hypothetical protein [Bradyrhizobium retamae]